ncbi:MAG: hypothetical protein WD200_04920 [Candidatus Andersenbacteria bacterium]
MRRYTFFTFGFFWRLLVLLAILAGGAWAWLQQDSQPQPEPEVRSAQDPSPSTIPDMDLVLAHVQSNGSRQVYICNPQCIPVDPPDTAEAGAVFDGRGWYHYRAGEKEDARQLVYKNGEEKLLVDQTSLVELRDLFLSPSGERLAYYLDDADSKPKKTELWMYDTKDGGTGLLAENITASDVITTPRWNSQSTALWFLADSGVGDEEKIEFVTVQALPAKISAQFPQLNFDNIKDDVSRGIVDISANGSSLAFASSSSNIAPAQLVTARGDGRVDKYPVVGAVVHVQWINDNTLLYATQHQQTLSFWITQSGTHSKIAETPGVLLSSHAASSQYLSFLLQLPNGQIQAHVLDSRVGLTKNIGSFAMPGGSVHLVQSKIRSANSQESLPASGFSDAELTAFVAEHIVEIATDPQANPLRVVITDQPNTVFVDVLSQEETQRLAIAVPDIIHPEWKILARYRAAGGQWQRTEGITQDPTPKRLYEWEESVKQWILKQDMDK